VGTSIASLFTITKTIGSDGLADENKAYSLTLTDAGGNPVLSGSTTGVLTNLHVTDTGVRRSRAVQKAIVRSRCLRFPTPRSSA
jgi:hypothetical protein